MSIPPATGPVICVRGLEKSYKELRVLRGVDFEVARGAIFALLGSNGAGKTTVKILSTLLKADTGMARVNGFDVATQAAGDSLTLPPEVTSYLGRLRQIGASERIVEAERGAWILVTARWPDRVREWMPAKIAQLDDPRLVRLYRLASELPETGRLTGRSGWRCRPASLRAPFRTRVTRTRTPRAALISGTRRLVRDK